MIKWNRKKIGVLLGGFFAVLLYFQIPGVRADVEVSCLGYSFQVPGNVALDPNFQGTLMVLTPQNDSFLISEGDPVPNIPSGSKIEIFKGTSDLAAGGQQSFSLSCGTKTQDQGEARILAKGIFVVDPTGDRQALQPGVIFPINLVGAPPAGEGSFPGTPVGDFPPADGRNITQSP